MLTEDSRVDQITAQWLDASPKTDDAKAIPARFVIYVRRSDRILKDGEVIGMTYHRHVLEKGDDLKGQDPTVRKVAKAIW